MNPEQKGILVLSLHTQKRKVLLVTFSQLRHFVDNTVKFLSFLSILTKQCINSMTAVLFLKDIVSVKGVDAEEDCGWAYSTYHSLG